MRVERHLLLEALLGQRLGPRPGGFSLSPPVRPGEVAAPGLTCPGCSWPHLPSPCPAPPPLPQASSPLTFRLLLRPGPPGPCAPRTPSQSPVSSRPGSLTCMSPARLPPPARPQHSHPHRSLRIHLPSPDIACEPPRSPTAEEDTPGRRHPPVGAPVWRSVRPPGGQGAPRAEAAPARGGPRADHPQPRPCGGAAKEPGVPETSLSPGGGRALGGCSAAAPPRPGWWWPRGPTRRRNELGDASQHVLFQSINDPCVCFQDGHSRTWPPVVHTCREAALLPGCGGRFHGEPSTCRPRVSPRWGQRGLGGGEWDARDPEGGPFPHLGG